MALITWPRLAGIGRPSRILDLGARFVTQTVQRSRSEILRRHSTFFWVSAVLVGRSVHPSTLYTPSSKCDREDVSPMVAPGTAVQLWRSPDSERHITKVLSSIPRSDRSSRSAANARSAVGARTDFKRSASWACESQHGRPTVPPDRGTN